MSLLKKIENKLSSNPVITTIAVAAVAIAVPSLIPAIGTLITTGSTAAAGAVLDATTTAGIQSAVAAAGTSMTAVSAAGGAAVSGATKAIEGGTPSQIGTAAAGGAVGGAVGANVGGGAPTDVVSGAEAGAASGAASGATQAALTGQNVGQSALKGAETGAVVGGGSSAATNLTNQVAAGGQPISQTVPNYAEPGGAPIETTIQANTSIVPEYSKYTPGGLGFAGSPGTADINSPLAVARYAPVAESVEDINLGANYNPNTTIFTPGGVVDYSLGPSKPSEGLSGTPPDALTTPVAGLSADTLGALKSAYGAGIGILLGGKAPGISAITPNISDTATTGTTSSTTGGAPGGTELDPSTGKTPQQVWGDKYTSLKEGLNV